MTPAGGAVLSDPEVLAFVAEVEAHYPASSNHASPAENRRAYDHMCAALRAPRPAGVAVRDRRLAAACPARAIPVREYRPAGAGGAGRRVIYLHGGGFVLGGLDSHDDIAAEISAATGLGVTAVDYRLAPEHTFPSALDDCREVWRELVLEGAEVILAGDSAGASLAAALCIGARRLGAPQPLRQVLVYPQLALELDAPSYREHAEAPLLRTADCERYLRLHRGPRPIPADRLPELAPLAAASFAGLAPAFIVTADIDPVRDDGRDYAARLVEAGVAAEWRNEAQLVHGFLRARHRSRRAAASFAAILAAVAAA